MKRILFFIFLNFAFITVNKAQSPVDSVLIPKNDSIVSADTVAFQDSLIILPVSDSVSRRPLGDSNWVLQKDSITTQYFCWEVLKRNRYFDFKSRPFIKQFASLKNFKGKEFIFYLLVFMLLIFAIFRQLFPKYFSDLFRVFFRTTLKQVQIREQLMQTPLPSLMLNGFFVLSAGLYITFLLEYLNINPFDNFWLLFFYCCIGLSVVYLVKFLGLKIAGWIFGIKEAMDAYVFIVFIINKMIGILLLPLLIIIAFGEGSIYSISFTTSWCLLAGLYLYRVIMAYAVVRNQIKVNPFHFFLYLCAFEIAPVLLVYRGLMLYFNVTA